MMNKKILRLPFLISLALSFLLSQLSAQEQQPGLQLNIITAHGDQKQVSMPFLLNGYAKSISGQKIDYRSAHPEAQRALLVRTRSDAPSISWETEPLPATSADGFNRFLWVTAIAKDGWKQSDEPRRFDMFINGEQWFSFRNVKDSTAKEWTVRGREGSELSFRCTWIDAAGDLHGLMTMKVPQSVGKAGMPLQLRVDGEKADQPDWYMVFEYSFNFTPKLRLEPALLKQGGSVVQTVRVSLDNLQLGTTLEIISTTNDTLRSTLKVGANIFFVSIPAVNRETTFPVVITWNGTRPLQQTLLVKPVTKREIFLLSYSHNDIGYTELQTEVEKKQSRNVDEALKIIKATRDYPSDAQYKWNMEVMWSVEGYMKQASEEKKREFINAIRNGSIGLNGLYANELTGLCNAPEMNNLMGYMRTFSSAYNVPVTTALISDVPGFTWGLVPALAQNGIKYFSPSPNPFDRTGHIYEYWGDKPFYWASQSGEEKILMWMPATGYAYFHEGDLTRMGDEKLLKLMRKLDESRYPYDMVQLPYTVGGDNGPPDPRLSDFVKSWNERYASPRLIIATHDQMFNEFEKRYGSTLQTVKGDFSPYWEDGAASTAYETGLNRQAVDRILQGEALWSMLKPKQYPEQDYYLAWRHAIMYDEHTWGAHNSISEPDLPFVLGQWAIKRQFAQDADSISRALLQKALPPSGKQVKNKIVLDVYNTLSWPRTDLIVLAKGKSSVGDLVVDERGRQLRSQRLATGELAVLVTDVPPLAAKRIFITPGKAFNPGSAVASALWLENKTFRASLNPKTGAIQSIVWKKSNVELVDSSKGLGGNQYLYIIGTNPDSAQRISKGKSLVKERGPLVTSLLVRADAPGCTDYLFELRFIDGLDRIDIINHITKKPVRQKEGVHIAFPWNVPNGILRYDVANGIVRAEEDQLPGSCKNYFSVQSWVDISNERFGLTWTTSDAPLVEMGAINAEQGWMKSLKPSQTFFSYIMNNYWHTNYKADQSGFVVFRYSIKPHLAYASEEAVKFGKEQREPLIVTPADPSRPLQPSLFTLSTSPIITTSLKPLENGNAWLINLYNPTADHQRVKLNWRKGETVGFFSSTPAGVRQANISTIDLAGYGSRYVIIERK
ncbi:MAG: hypothetical protein V1799_13620 [bacterium]